METYQPDNEVARQLALQNHRDLVEDIEAYRLFALLCQNPTVVCRKKKVKLGNIACGFGIMVSRHAESNSGSKGGPVT